MARKGALAFGAPLPSPGLQPIRTDLIHARHLGHTLSRVELAHDGNLQFAGILLSGHKHCSPPFNVIGPLNSCLTFGVQSISSLAEDAHLIDVFEKLPGLYRPLLEYHEILLRGPSPLTVAERELIAAYVSALNACNYCHGV